MFSEPVLEADLHLEDDEGNNWTLVDRAVFVPGWIHPGAIIRVGDAGGATEAEVLRTELSHSPSGTQRILVTFRQIGHESGAARVIR